MRFSVATLACAVAVALLAGCSNSSQSASALPGSGAGTSATLGQHLAPASRYQPKGGVNHKDLLRLQAEGKIPTIGRQIAAEKAYQQIQRNGRPRIRPDGGTTAMWLSMTDYDYLVGAPKSGKKITAAIDTATSECYEPYGLKVDGSNNIWAGCDEGGSSDTPTAIEFSSSGSLKNRYSFACPSGWNSCDDYFYGYAGYDTAEDSSHVFMDGYYYGYDCTTVDDCSYTSGQGIEWWDQGDSSGTPTMIVMPYGSDNLYVYDLYYMDEDTSGNLWVGTYCYDTNDGHEGYGLLKVSNPTSSPSFSLIEDCGNYESNGGVYVSNSGGTLNYLDPETRLIYQYTLPLSTGASPKDELGPTAPFGYPEGIGFNSGDTNVVAGDEDEWINIGTVATNKWKQKKPVLLVDGLYGAAYTPSDK